MVFAGGFVRGKHDIANLAKRRLGLVNTVLSSSDDLAGAARGQKRIWWQIWAGHFVFFSVQNACVGICRHFLLCGEHGGVWRWICAAATRPGSHGKATAITLSQHFEMNQ
jgi:hypothetical protein